MLANIYIIVAMLVSIWKFIKVQQYTFNGILLALWTGITWPYLAANYAISIVYVIIMAFKFHDEEVALAKMETVVKVFVRMMLMIYPWDADNLDGYDRYCEQLAKQWYDENRD